MSIIRRKAESIGTLVLRIKNGESILLGDNMEIILAEIESRNRVKVVIKSPNSTKVRRKNFEETRNKTEREDTGET